MGYQYKEKSCLRLGFTYGSIISFLKGGIFPPFFFIFVRTIQS